MAKDGKAYSPKEFKLAFVAESTIGTANTTSMQLVNVDSVTMPNLNPVIVNNLRSGDGRVRKTADSFVCQKGIVKTIPFSGIADTKVLPLLVQNIMTNTVGTSPASYDVPYNYAPPELLNGDSSGITKTVTVALISPEGSNSIIFPGCTLTKLQISAGIDDENGRWKISGEFETKCIHSDEQAAPTGLSSYGSTYYYLTEWNAKTTFAGIADCVIDGFTLDLENPNGYSGFDSNGDPDAINRGIGDGFISNMTATVKYDANTAPLKADLVDGGTTSSIECSDNATWASATKGIKSDNALITSVAFNENSSMYLDVTVEMQSDGAADDVIQLVV